MALVLLLFLRTLSFAASLDGKVSKQVRRSNLVFKHRPFPWLHVLTAPSAAGVDFP